MASANIRGGLFQALSLKPSILAEAMTHPGWIVEYFKRGGGTPMLGNWEPYAPAGSDAEAVYKHSSSLRPFNAQTWRDLETYRKLFPRALVVKGIMSPADALRALDVGCDGILVSNHGGRQLDQAPGSLDVLPAIKAAVGDKLTLLLDSGVRRGADILIALCLGADFCFMGRPTLYGAAAGGLPGVKKAVDIFVKEIDLVMGQIGCPEPRSARPRFPVARRLGTQRLIARDCRIMNFDQAVNIEDLHRIAKRKLPKIIFDYIEGGVEDERGFSRNEAAFHKHKLLPRYLVDVSKRDQSTTVFGRTYSSPFGISPTGSVGLYRREGEVMLAQAAAAANIPYIMSGAANASMEEALKVAPNNVWFQLYAAKDANVTDALIGRARDAGAGALVLTVDVPVHPKRERNYRNGFSRIRGGGVMECAKAEAVDPAGGGDPPRLGHRIYAPRRCAGPGELGAARSERCQHRGCHSLWPGSDPGRRTDLARSRTLPPPLSRARWSSRAS